MSNKPFSARLQALRKERGVTQEQLSAHLGVSPQAVSKWENGSYPDGDLLPSLADFFNVSIDYLYGRAERNLSVEQRIIDELQSIKQNDDNTHAEYIEKVLDYLWATQIAAWRENKYWYNRPSELGKNSYTASCVIDVKGFTHMRLNEDLQYYFIAKTPEEGFADRLGDVEKFAPLFEFLGDKINLKVLFYMLSLNNGEMVKASTVAKRLGIPCERAEKALSYLCGMSGSGNNAFDDGSIINDDEKTEKVYIGYSNKTNIFIMLLAAADTLLFQPNGYQMQVGFSAKSWFDREKLSFLKKKAD